MQRKNENNVSKECILTPFEMAEIFLITMSLKHALRQYFKWFWTAEKWKQCLYSKACIL